MKTLFTLLLLSPVFYFAQSQPLVKQIYDFNVGDTLEYSIISNLVFLPLSEQYVVVGKDSTANSLTYTIVVRNTFNWSVDTAVTVINNCNDIFIPRIATFACFEPGDDTLCTYFDSAFIDAFCGGEVYGEWRTCMQAATSHSLYKSGLGLVENAYFCNSFSGGTQYLKRLTYYNKTGGTYCGTPSLLFNDIPDSQTPKASVVPNPATNTFMVNSVSEENSDALISLYSHSGQKVLELQITTPQTNVDCSYLPGGLYFWVVSTQLNIATGKLLLMNP